MAEYIDQNKWQDALREPDWYVRLDEDFRGLEKYADTLSEAEHQRVKDQAYGLVEQALADGVLPFAEEGENLDKERRPIDIIVIHHTKNRPGLSLARLNAIQLLRIYGRYYANPTDPREQHFKGQSVWSNHFYKGQQVFWGYHWLVRNDGTVEQLLADDKIGWHAGNWDINTRSIGICIDDDLTEKAPTDAAIATISCLVRKRYAAVKPSNLVGHADINHQTICPGRLFKSDWRQQILK